MIKNSHILKFALFIGAFFLHAHLFAQNNILELLPGSEKVIYDERTGIHRLLGNVNFTYQGNTMYCDSAHYQEKQKLVHAYGNVQIRKNDVNLFCDSLSYNGSTKYAKLWGHVKVRDREYKITTDSMDYDAKQGKGIYRNKGKIESIVSNERITSKVGYFFPQKQNFFFSGNVNYRKDDLTMTTDTLQFAYEKQTAYFFGPTKIVNDSVTILCKKGWYNVQKEEGTLYKKAEIIQKNTIMKGDTLYYHGKIQEYEGRGNVFYKDFEQNMIFVGDKAYSSEAKKTTYLTGHALALKVKDKDTIYIHADSLILKKDSLNATDKINGYDHVRIFQKSIQASCDSAVYEPKNDKLFLRSKPMVWAQNAELKGVLMEITLKDSLVERIDISGNASVVMELDSGKYYNQITGREMVAFFKNNELIRSDVKGNSWTIFYPEDEEKTDSLVTKKRMGMNRLFASDLRIYLDSGEVSGITYFDKPDGIFYPMNQIKTEEQFIKGFEWNPMLRPKDPIKMMEKN